MLGLMKLKKAGSSYYYLLAFFLFIISLYCFDIFVPYWLSANDHKWDLNQKGCIGVEMISNFILPI